MTFNLLPSPGCNGGDVGGQGGEGYAHHPYQAEQRGDLYVMGGEGVVEDENKGVQHSQVFCRGDVQLAMLQAHLKDLHMVCV